MKLRKTINLIGTIREEANKFIVAELEKAGIKGIVPSHGAVLMALYKNKSMTMKDIAEKIKRTQPTVTVLINKLISFRYVTKEKSEDDSRITYIKLTKKGEEFRPIFFAISDKVNTKLHKGLTEEESETLDSLLERVASNW